MSFFYFSSIVLVFLINSFNLPLGSATSNCIVIHQPQLRACVRAIMVFGKIYFNECELQIQAGADPGFSNRGVAKAVHIPSVKLEVPYILSWSEIAQYS